MKPEVVPISLPLGPGPIGLLARVHAFLAIEPTSRDAILFDAGSPGSAALVEKALEARGVRLRLICLTHPHFDHVGDAAYLARRHGVPIAASPGAREPLASGDLRIPRNLGAATWLRPVFVGLRGLAKCTPVHPEIELLDGLSLLPWGLSATAIANPGHDPDHFAFLLEGGDVLAGDTWVRRGRRALVNDFWDDRDAIQTSAARLRELATGTIWVCHGERLAPD